MPDNDAVGDSNAPWMAWMRRNRGQVQQTGAQPTDFTTRIFAYTTYGDLHGHTPESCAATVCAALEETGYKSTRSAAAISYKAYGTACDLQPNCVVVYEWPTGGHHVDFCDKIVDANTIMGLGGNQGHSLQDSLFAKKFIIATRWPVKAEGANLAAMAIPVQAFMAAPPAGLAPAATFTVHQGQRYTATVTLSGVEQFATNEMIVAKLEAVGFENVVVTGSGKTRQAEGSWGGADATATLDAHIGNIQEVT